MASTHLTGASSSAVVVGLLVTGVLLAAQTSGKVAPGTWGGDHIRLEVTDKGGEVEFDCARGVIDESLITDSRGRFDAKGSYVVESPGPRREDVPAQSRLARYVGQIQDSTMTLTITLSEDAGVVGTFSLKKDRLSRITKCG
jgi:hypothetical protein